MTPRAGLLVYIAGPLTPGHGRTLEENLAPAFGAYLELIRAGVAADCPHLNALVPGAFDVDYEAWLARDFQVIERSDAILLLPNWEQSEGAVRERGLAIALGKRVYMSVAELIAAEAARP